MEALALQATHQNSDGYDAFVQRINNRFAALAGPIFETSAVGLYETYLQAFADPVARQYHTCSCCKQFIERFGHLATVNSAGHLVSAIWDKDDAPDHYKPAVAAMERLVRRAQITMPFLSSEPMYGTPASTVRASGHIWTHFAVKPPAARIFRETRLLSAFQLASAKREEFGTVRQALTEYDATTVAVALRLLKDDQLGNSAAALGQAQFLADLHKARADSMNTDNTTWAMVAAAPSGLCHPRSSMIATLLDDIRAGKTFEQAQAAWNAKMHPLAYQRPKAPPSAGNIAQAEKLFGALGLAPALQRRIARLDEIAKLWEPRPVAPAPTGGIFGHLTPKGSTASELGLTAPALAMTLEKFVRTVIPTAEKVEVQLASQVNFIAITTAVDPDAPQLFQWDHSFAWYCWHGGRPVSQYGLSPGWNPVAGITRLPARWGDEAAEKFKHQGDGVILLIDGARETRSAGAALFPACLRSELREVRSTIEAHSSAATMAGLTDGSAIGVDMRQGGDANFPVNVRVLAAGQTQTYKIDRWD